MSHRTNSRDRGGRHLERPVSLRQRYRTWKRALTRGQRLRYRILESATAISAVIVLLWAVYSLLVRPPELEQPNISVVGSNVSQAELEKLHISQVGQREGVYTVLVVGKDTGGGGNTDTMILAAYDTKNKTVDAMSLPRDTMVNVSWNTKKLNTVYNYYKGRDKDTHVEKGMDALKTHVGRLTGVTPNYYVIVEWDAVGELVDALDGVTFNVPYDMHYDDPEQDLHIHQDKGERRLSGDDAMQVIRWRKNNGKYGNLQVGDSGRMKIQQDFLMAVAKECLQMKHLKNVGEFAEIFAENVTTDLTVSNIVWFGQKAIGMDAARDVRFHTMPYTAYNRNTAYVLPVVDELLAIVNDGLNPYKRDIRADDLEVLLLQDNGAFSLTSGTLEDKALAKPRVSKPAAQKPTQPEAPPQVEPRVRPDEPISPEQPGEDVQAPETQGSSGGEQTPVQPELSGEGGGHRPGPEEPSDGEEPIQPPSQTELPAEGPQTTQEPTQESVAPANVLPARPEPIQ